MLFNEYDLLVRFVNDISIISIARRFADGFEDELHHISPMPLTNKVLLSATNV